MWPLDHALIYVYSRCNAYIFYCMFRLIDGDFGGFVIMRLSDGQNRCRDQLRRQGDQETQRIIEHILSLVNRTNSMGWWVRERQSLAG